MKRENVKLATKLEGYIERCEDFLTGTKCRIHIGSERASFYNTNDHFTHLSKIGLNEEFQKIFDQVALSLIVIRINEQKAAYEKELAALD